MTEERLVGVGRLPALHVTRGQGPVHVELGAALLTKAAVSEEDNTCYVVTCLRTGHRLLVDAADDAPTVLATLSAAADVAGTLSAAADVAGTRSDAADVAGAPDGSLVGVVTTHGHWDHHRALPEVLTATGAPSLVGRDDAADLPVRPDRLLDHGDTIEVGDLRLDVVHLRGHTPGSVALVLTAALVAPALALTGDSLFPGGVGNTWRDPARFASLLDDVESRLFDVLPDDTLVQPGHGDGTTLGAERNSLAEWRRRGW